MEGKEPSRAVYYGLDTAPRCLFELRRSIASVRQHCQTLPIYVALTGALDAADRAFLDAHAVTVLPTERDGRVSPVFMKWQALMHRFREADVLCLDTDTIALDDVSRLFESEGPEDFHARLEIACDPDASRYPCIVNMWVIPDSQIDHRLLQALCERIGARPRPVWSTGVMLFRNGLAGRLADRWPDFVRLDRLFSRKRLPYPCKNPHIVEEVVASVVLGTIETLTWAFLPPTSSLTFPEYMERDSASPTILHTGSSYYLRYLCRAGDPQAMRAYLALPAKRYKKWTQALLPLGSTKLTVPQWALERWLRFGTTTLASAAQQRV